MEGVNTEEKITTYKGSYKPTWCKGCGDFSLLTALDRALKEYGAPPHEVAVISGIGCSSRFPYFMETYGMHSAHGRALPVAIGLKTARPELNVVVTSGDGDALSIGGNHFIHAMRRNVDITLLLMNNQIYGMTKGQTSPTSFTGFVTKSSPYGSVEKPIDPVWMALTTGATYVAQAPFHQVKPLQQTILEAMQHKGMSVVVVLSPCLTYNKKADKNFYDEHSVELPEGYDCSDYNQALNVISGNPMRFPIGLIYHKQEPTLDDGLERIAAQATARGPVKMIDVVQEFL
jgi:2-oxoglutarate ferredoxin oxidoreductase subunit beta